MLKENNQQASILNHDFKEHIGALSSLIGLIMKPLRNI